MTRNGVPNARGAKRDFTAGGRPIQHGRPASYTYHKCGCTECREAYRVYAKRHREGRGKPQLVLSVGSTRKLRALAVMGHPMVSVAAEAGLHASHVYGICAGRLRWIHVDTAAKITAVYKRLSSVIPMGRQATSVRNAAKRKGWVSVADWHNIDDPNETQEPPPDGADECADEEIVRRLIAGVTTPARDVDRREAARLMAAANKPGSLIAERCRMSYLTVKKIREGTAA